MSGLDYWTFNDIIHFDRCATQKCVNITVIDDDIVEKVEHFLLKLALETPGLSDIIDLSPMAGRVRIISEECKNLTVYNVC